MKKEKNKKLQKLWVLYGAFFCIMMVLVGLFVSDAFNTADYEEFVQFKEKQESLNLATAKSTDLRNGSSDYDFTIPIINPNDSSIIMTARINEYDITIATEDRDKLSSPLVYVTVILQFLSYICLVAIFIFVFIILYSLYKSIKNGKVFQKKNILWLRIVGLLLIVMTLCEDFARYFEYQYVQQFLANTSVVIDDKFYLHFTRILLGLLILFVSELFKIGYDIQEEQDLTI